MLLRTLGAARIDSPAGHLSSRRKELTLLAFLARRGARHVSRAELAALLWEGHEEARARQSLRQALLELKRVVGDALLIDGERVGVDPAGLRVDASEFERAAREGRLAEAVEWWGGDFLPAMDDVGGEALRVWLEIERENLRRLLAWTLERLTSGAAAHGDWSEAVTWAERWMAELPLDERGCRHLVEALRLAGRPAEARARYASFASRLRGELGAEPGPDLVRVAALLDSEGERAAAHHRPGSAALFTPDLVGRGPALGELATAWESARAGRPTVVLVEGESGIGKTRLIEEFMRRITASGPPAVVVRLSAAEPSALPRLLVDALADAPGLPAASPDALPVLAPVSPRLRERFPELGSPRRPIRLDAAIAEALSAVAEERPLLLFIDEVEAGAEIAVPLVVATARQARGAILVVLGLRADEQPLSALGPLAGVPGVRRIKLGPLSPAETEALVASMLVLPPKDRRTLAARLHRESGGNPLYASELAAALVDEGVLAVGEEGTWRLLRADWSGGEVPRGLRPLLQRRLAHLGPEARTVARAMAAMESPALDAEARRATGLPADRFDLGRDELLARRLIRPEADRPAAFHFTHELIRRAAREAPGAAAGTETPPTSRRRVRRWRLAAGALAALGGLSAVVAIRYLAARSDRPAPALRQVVLARAELPHGANAADSAAAATLAQTLDRAARDFLLPAADMRAALGRMRRRDTTAPPDEASAREVGLRTGTRLVLVPWLSRSEGRWTAGYRLVNAETGEAVALREREDRGGSAVAPIAKLAASLPHEIELAAERIPARPAMPKLTTASLEALQAYEAAFRLIDDSDPAWLSLMLRALELDSTFAAAHGSLAFHYWFVYDQRNAARHAVEAARLAAGLPVEERLQIMLDAANAREDWGAAITSARALLERNRRNGAAWHTLGQLYYFDGQYARAVEAYDSSLAHGGLSRPNVLDINRATVLARFGREAEAARLYEAGIAADSALLRHPFVSHEYGATLVRLGRKEDARAAYRRRLPDLPAVRAGGLRSLALLEVHDGHFTRAAELLEEATVTSGAAADTLGAVIAHLLLADIRIAQGRPAEALSALRHIQAIAATRLLPYEVLGRSIKLLARIGAARRAEALLVTMREQTLAVSRAARARTLLATGELWLAQGRTDQGRAALEQALALQPTNDALESAAYAAMMGGDVETAARRFDTLAAQRAIDWEGHAVIEFPRFQAARAWERAGRLPEAAARYARFLADWPSADSSLPAVVDARRRQASLPPVPNVSRGHAPDTSPRLPPAVSTRSARRSRWSRFRLPAARTGRRRARDRSPIRPRDMRGDTRRARGSRQSPS